MTTVCLSVCLSAWDEKTLECEMQIMWNEITRDVFFLFFYL